jgi:HSP20 family protein
LSWWDENNEDDDDWRFRKKKSRRGYWDDIFARMVEDINAMFRDFDKWPEFPGRTRPFVVEDKLNDKLDDKTDNTDSEIRGPFVYGFRYRLGPDGKPEFEEFGNVRPSPQGAITSDNREPLVDILQGTDELEILIKLPGVRKEGINLKTTEKTMRIVAIHGDYKYEKILDLPVEVQPESATA